ncbi:MAG: hypothetical protein AAF266_13065 [Planctomycetota bacterium]
MKHTAEYRPGFSSRAREHDTCRVDINAVKSEVATNDLKLTEESLETLPNCPTRQADLATGHGEIVPNNASADVDFAPVESPKIVTDHATLPEVELGRATDRRRCDVRRHSDHGIELGCNRTGCGQAESSGDLGDCSSVLEHLSVVGIGGHQVRRFEETDKKAGTLRPRASSPALDVVVRLAFREWLLRHAKQMFTPGTVAGMCGAWKEKAIIAADLLPGAAITQ